FFFPSRSRHTSFSRDWSSDVCSSDLPFVGSRPLKCLRNIGQPEWKRRAFRSIGMIERNEPVEIESHCIAEKHLAFEEAGHTRLKIGRASCRERVDEVVLQRRTTEETV